MSPCIFIVMAVFRPEPAFLSAQIRSLAGQTHEPRHLIAVIADTSSDALVTELAAAADLPCTILPSDFALDSVRAFEAGMTEALRLITARGLSDDAALIALSDQDDIWRPDRLEKGVAALLKTGADLVHSDARLVDTDGHTILQPSMFTYERRMRKPGLRGLLYRNNITGMTTLMRPRLLRLALPFPAQSGVHFYHDLWLGLLAAATGGVHLIEEPLVDYRQHGTNAIGAVDRRRGWRIRLKRPDAIWLRNEATAYGLARYLAQSAYNRLVDATADGRIGHGDAQVAPLRPFLKRTRGAGAHLWDAVKLGLQRHTDLARIAAGFATVSAGRTIWCLREALGPGLNNAIDGFDTRLYSLSPGMLPQAPASLPKTNAPAVPHQSIVDLRKEPRWTPSFSADHAALNILVPTLNPTEIFAGIATALDIGLGLAARGHKIRFICTDLPLASPGASRSFVLGRLAGRWDINIVARNVSLHCGVQSKTLKLNNADMFMATAWWSAHVAERILRRHGMPHKRFLYLIQDFEPHFYPWGPEFADAMASYDFDFEPIFNTTLLRDWFANLGFDFAKPDSLAFHPSIDISRYSRVTRAAPQDGRRRLALYGRPDVPRNMYATAIEALARFVTNEGLGPQDIELVSIGQQHGDVSLPGQLSLKSKGKLAWEDYPDYLGSVDLGLSLMYSPHPSHPPIEMAAAGVRVVTNNLGPKDLSRLSPAILSTPATAPALADALSKAWHAGPVPDADRDIDLQALGIHPETMIDKLAKQLAGRLPVRQAS
ncbi:glycosyltransferase [uncultured Roseovarius sp.]|uniref:rhamnosyltransferase WsaF family glycosyltransferase n=1 Tax=uncultured Roseovarius sp. TaxID=293344 RepID=UPI00262B8F22|nr:glycosyltransferase [uncultured Roseovarius sp.]